MYDNICSKCPPWVGWSFVFFRHGRALFQCSGLAVGGTKNPAAFQFLGIRGKIERSRD
jgi:hypothetical protein